MINFGDHSLASIFIVSLIAILSASEVGRWLGSHGTAAKESNVSTLEAATLGLLALMISFTFAMALTRFEARRDAVLNEANAIGTTGLRARLLPSPHNSESLKLLREYTQLRLDVAQTLTSDSEIAAAVTRSNALQEALWQQARAVAAKDNAMVPTGLFIQTLNEMIDNHEKRLIAFRNRIPNIVLAALYGIAIVGSAFSGYATGLDRPRSRLTVYVMGVLIAAMTLLIQDLDRPTGGFITTSQQPMIDAAAALAGYQD